MKMNEVKNCKECGRDLPKSLDYFYKKKDTTDGFANKCKECLGYKFTKLLTLKKGEMICKKCEKTLPHNSEYFPIDKNTKSGLRNVCYKCKGSRYGKRKPQPKNWTKEEDDLLKAVYPDSLNKEILHLFPNRTNKAIMDRAVLLGVSKSEISLEKRYEAHSEFMFHNSSWIGIPKTEVEKASTSQRIKNLWKENPVEMLASVRYERNSDHREYLSKIKREAGLWKGENNPRFINPLNGSDNGRWLGGITPLLLWLRNQLSDWKRDSMEYHHYKCILTGEDFDDIHHIYSFKNIVKETLENLSFDYTKTLENYTENELETLRAEIIKNNNKYGYGACLTKDVHKLFHDLYGYGDNTPEQFEEYKKRFQNGEFSKILKERGA